MTTSSHGQDEGQHEKLPSIVEESHKTHPPPPPPSSSPPLIPPPPPGSPPLENRPPPSSTTEQIPRHRGNRGTGNSQHRERKRPSDARPTGQGYKKWRGSSQK
ncbi:hypothetical protein H9Q73_000401 [Fusarium xylarioides]|nr:hypothetical protein H9Q73_000401 [Fusarium xylarioides]